MRLEFRNNAFLDTPQLSPCLIHLSALICCINTHKNKNIEICSLEHINNIPVTQCFTGISRNTQSKSYILSLTECVWNFQIMHQGILINILWSAYSLRGLGSIPSLETPRDGEMDPSLVQLNIQNLSWRRGVKLNKQYVHGNLEVSLVETSLLPCSCFIQIKLFCSWKRAYILFRAQPLKSIE